MEVVKIKVGFIGAGKVGFSLGKLFTINNLDLSGYYSKSFSSAKAAADFTCTKPFQSIAELVLHSDIIFITVPDDEISTVYSDLKKHSIKGKIVCHTSGCLSSQVFSDIDDLDAYPYSIHPMFPISHKTESYKHLKSAVFTIEGHKKYMNTLIDIFSSMGISILPIESKDKTLYHLASVCSSNLFLGLLNRSCSYLKEYGFNEADAVKALLPLIKNNIENVTSFGITAALTGPVERADINTVKKHIHCMPKEHVNVYCELSKDLVEIAEHKNINRDYSQLKQLLEDCNEEYSNDI